MPQPSGLKAGGLRFVAFTKNFQNRKKTGKIPCEAKLVVV